MKKRNQKLYSRQMAFTLVEIMIVVAIIALLAVMILPNMLRAQTTPAPGTTVYSPNFYRYLTNWTGASVTNATTLPMTIGETNGDAVTVSQGKGEAFLISATLPNAGDVSNLNFTFDVTADGTKTNWTTNAPFLNANILGQGAKTVVGCIYFPSTQLSCVRSIYPTGCANSNGHIATINWIQESHANQ